MNDRCQVHGCDDKADLEFRAKGGTWCSYHAPGGGLVRELNKGLTRLSKPGSHTSFSE